MRDTACATRVGLSGRRKNRRESWVVLLSEHVYLMATPLIRGRKDFRVAVKVYEIRAGKNWYSQDEIEGAERQRVRRLVHRQAALQYINRVRQVGQFAPTRRREQLPEKRPAPWN